MSSAGFTKRRGLRTIVSRGPIINQRVELALECGHSVTRGAGGVRFGSKEAVCPTCRATDGQARDAAKAALP